MSALQEIDPAKVKELRNKGYSDSEIEKAYEKIKKEESQTTQRGSYNYGRPDDNIAKLQLEVNDMLEQIEHFLRGDVPTSDGQGNVKWVTPNEDQRRLNDKGVELLMQILSGYITRNTMLSNYNEKQINAMIYRLGCDISDVVYTKYNEIGLDTPKKRKEYRVIVMQIKDMVWSTYLRALNGEERKSLREHSQFNFTDPHSMPQQYPRENRNMINPLNWMGRGGR